MLRQLIIKFMSREEALEIKIKTDKLFIDLNILLEDYQKSLDEVEFQVVKTNVGTIFGIIYFDCLREYIYKKFTDLEP